MKYRVKKRDARRSGFIYVGKLMKESPVTQELWLMTQSSEAPVESRDPLEVLSEAWNKGEEEGKETPLLVAVPNFDICTIDPYELFENFSLASAR